MKRSSHGINWVIVSVIFSLPRARALESGGLIETTDGDMLCDVSKSNHTVLPFSYQEIDGPGLTSYSCKRIITSFLASQLGALFAARSRTARRASVPFFPRTDVPVERLREWDYYPTNLSSRTPTGPMLVFETLRTAAWPGG